MLQSAVGFIVVLIFFMTFAIQPVTGVTVENPIIKFDALPGTTYRFPMAVSIKPGDSASDYAVEVLGFGQLGEGLYTPLTAAEDTGPYSARSFVTIDSPLFHLDPGQRQPFNVTIKVPQDAGEGGRYALIFIHPSAVNTGQSSITTGILAPVMLTIQGSSLTHTGSITNFQAGESVPGMPIEIETTLKNTGNHHYYSPLVNVTITDSTGNLVATGFSTTVVALIPENNITFTTPITTALAPGTYTVKSEAKIAEGMVLLDTKTTSFTIQAPYVPPTQQTFRAGGTQLPTGTTATPAETAAPKKIPFLPIYTPWPDALVTVGVLSAVILLWSARRR